MTLFFPYSPIYLVRDELSQYISFINMGNILMQLINLALH